MSIKGFITKGWGNWIILTKTHRFSRPHGKEVRHHGAESRSKTGLCDESKFELCEADHVVPLLPVPAGDVQQVGLVVVLHQLDDHADVVAVVLDRDHPHDVGSVFCIRILAVLVGQHKAGVSLMNLKSRVRQKEGMDEETRFLNCKSNSE